MSIIVGKVYANWCGHCQSLKPEWKKMKQSIPKGSVRLIEIEESETGKRAQFEKTNNVTLDVNGFPTIFKIQPGKPVEYYSGERTAEIMKQWILQQGGKKNRKTRVRKSNKRVTRKNLFGFFIYK